ncbi:uncharacterized protein LOC119772646 [Cyprinodon tularosa]|uniref:uncharacterized protein LOC119772646 n=1 Tax=Cyprinodon tularosa TaxID=77115 RepID=UPI0018E21447|nr:uncharacterized protein LOC119772646 [Cyprinodon tularosa]
MELSKVRLVCDLRGYFPNKLTVKWYKNGQEIQNISPNETTFQSLDGEAITYSRTTEIKVDMEDWKTGSSFTCESIKQGTKIAKTTDICQTSSTPPVIEIVNPVFAVVMTQSSVSATCLVHTSLNAKITWLLDGNAPSRLTEKVKQVKSSSLITSNVEVPSDKWRKLKSITCKAQHTCFSSSEKTVTVTGSPVTSPQVEIRRSFPDLLNGTSNVFQCYISQLSSHDLFVTFQTNGKNIPEQYYVNLPEGPVNYSVSRKFTVPMENLKNNPDMTCTVNQGFSNSSFKSNTIRNIFVPPSVELYLDSSKTSDEQTLLCSGWGFNPQIKWLIGSDQIVTANNDISIDRMERAAVTSRLQVPLSEWKSGMVFTCEVSDPSLKKVVKKEISVCSVSSSTPPVIEIVNPVFAVVMTQSSVKATCLVHTSLNAEVTWLLDGNAPSRLTEKVKQVKSSSLITSNVEVPSDKWRKLKSITCKAQHTCFSSSEKTVTVTGSPVRSPQVEIRRSFPDLLNGTSNVFQCYISQLSSHDLFVTFQTNGKNIPEQYYVNLPEGPVNYSVSRKFTVPMENLKNNPDMTCTVNQGFSNSSFMSNTMRNIFVPPSAELYLDSSKTLDKQTLLCSGSGFNPQIKWLNGSDQIVTANNDISIDRMERASVTSRLQVPLSEWKSGMVFTCEVSDPSLKMVVKKEISVCSVMAKSSHMASVFIQRPALEEHKNRGQVTVACLFVGTSLSDFSVTWVVHGHQSSPSHIYTERPKNHNNGSETLHSFLNVSAEDWYSNKRVSCVGKHLCSNKSYEDHISKSIDLYQPVLRILKPTFTELYMSKSIMITCLVSGFFPSDIIVQWKENGQTLPVSRYINSPSWKEPGTSYFSMRSRLNVTKAEDNNSTYSCVVRHESSEAPVETSISDVFASVTYTKPSAVLLQGEDELVCLVSGFSPPAINITWFRSKTTELFDYTLTEPSEGQDGKFIIQSHLRLAPIDSLPGVVITCRVTHEGTTLLLNMSNPDSLEHCNFFDAIKDVDVGEDALKETWSMALTFLCFFLFAIIFSVVVLIIKTK